MLYIIRGSVIACEESWYHKRIYNRFKQAYFRNIYEKADFGFSGEKNIAEFHENLANQQRVNSYYKTLYDINQLPVENDSLFPTLETQPIVIEEIYIKPGQFDIKEKYQELINNSEQPKIEGCSGSHLVIFVHGYEGCSYDMK